VVGAVQQQQFLVRRGDAGDQRLAVDAAARGEGRGARGGRESGEGESGEECGVQCARVSVGTATEGVCVGGKGSSRGMACERVMHLPLCAFVRQPVQHQQGLRD